jgi:hypothetical protein
MPVFLSFCAKRDWPGAIRPIGEGELPDTASAIFLVFEIPEFWRGNHTFLADFLVHSLLFSKIEKRRVQGLYRALPFVS